MEGNFTVYILLNAKKRRYIGITSDISHRLEQHNKGLSRYTKGKGPWKVIWQSCDLTHNAALLLEAHMKKQHGGGGLRKLMRIYGRGS